MRVVRNTTMSKNISGGSDGVVAWTPVPAGGRLLGVQGELHIIGPEAARVDNFHAFGFSGELVPVNDPDTGVGIDTLWDEMVTKTAVATEAYGTSGITVDYDWDTADTDPDVEPGEVDVNDLTGLLDATREIFPPRIEWMSAAKGNPMSVAAGTPDTYTPRAFKQFRSSRKMVAAQPSYAMLALSAPALDRNIASASTMGTVKDWAILENLRNVMDDFWRINTGMIESGAESPYDFISKAVGDLVSPTMVQPATPLMVSASVTFMCQATWFLDFPGTSVPGTLEGSNE